MNKGKILFTAIVVLFIIGIIAVLVNAIIKDNNVVRCYSERRPGSSVLKTIELSEYSCEEIDYAIKSDIGLNWKISDVEYFRHIFCEKGPSREHVNHTKEWILNSTSTQNYNKERMARYYLSNCINDKKEVNDDGN